MRHYREVEQEIIEKSEVDIDSTICLIRVQKGTELKTLSRNYDCDVELPGYSTYQANTIGAEWLDDIDWDTMMLIVADEDDVITKDMADDEIQPYMEAEECLLKPGCGEIVMIVKR